MVAVMCFSLYMESYLLYFIVLNLNQKKLYSVHMAHFLAKSFLASKIPGSCKFQSDLLATNGGIDMFAMR